ncbi:hypothetical protein KIM67_10655 [Flagellimonas sp. 389]|uniref:hypothetical protein n=1 Tax=Flagellimonas sp. 389 TaxID=2835862 RepID=UPI001BD6A190|nr:hypothetical protein [Flagellimonas sp. 389]MBS9462873.1 hypothetical protein [Flagellimonas sp. 389]
MIINKYSTKANILLFLFPIFSVLLGCGKDEGEKPEEKVIEITIEDAALTIPENPSNGTVLLTMTASTTSNDPLSFSITSQSPTNAMAMDPSTGQITVLDSEKFDYEIHPELTATVSASSGNFSESAEVKITLTDVDENAPPAVGDVSFSVAENIDDTVVIGIITATDAENDPLQFSLADPTAYNSLFELTTSGELSITLGNSLDYETETQYTIQVNVSDGVNIAQATITVDVTNIIEVTVEIVAGSTTNANGTADGIGTAARFNIPADIVLHTDGSLYVSDRGTSLIRAIDGNANVTTYAGGGPTNADGIGTAAGFSGPVGIDNNSNGEIYVADSQSHVIRKIVAGADVTTFAGNTGTNGFVDGDLTDARFASPSGLAIATDGTIYIADRVNHAIRKISNGMVTTLAGNGTAGFSDGQETSASFNLPHSIDVDSEGNIYVADQGNRAIRKITPNGAVTTIAGNGSIGLENGPGQDAEFGGTIRGIAVDDNGNVYVSDTSNQVIRMLINNSGSYDVITLVGLANNAGYMDGDGSIAQFFNPAGITYTSDNILYVTEEGGNRVRKIIVE